MRDLLLEIGLRVRSKALMGWVYGEATLKDCYPHLFLIARDRGGGGRPFQWTSIWRAPAFFSWCVALEPILTADNLRTQEVVIVE
uniref:Reverse transcriptase zinc-binding domain-containing protein n=1 Tax=Fagus sylvatica TaxID=28930 RepID=A0A2N9IAR6_FAGSY